MQLPWSTISVLGLILAKQHLFFRVSVSTTSAHRPHRRPLFVDCHSRWLGIDRQCTHSLHRNDVACCHFELCCDCGLGCFSELFLADIGRLRRLLVAAVVFLYQITVFLQQNTTASFLELYFNDSIQTVYARGGGGSQQREVADGADVVFTDNDFFRRVSGPGNRDCIPSDPLPAAGCPGSREWPVAGKTSVLNALMTCNSKRIIFVM